MPLRSRVVPQRPNAETLLPTRASLRTDLDPTMSTANDLGTPHAQSPHRLVGLAFLPSPHRLLTETLLIRPEAGSPATRQHVPIIEPRTAPEGTGSRYPAPFNEPCLKRQWRKLGDAAGLTQFGVNLVTLKPGVWSSQRHWHSEEDEFAYVISGEVVLVEDDGEHFLKPGDCVGWKAGVANGHCLQNRSTSDATLLVVGGRSETDRGAYSDIDMAFERGSGGTVTYTRKDGSGF
jgi:uncharacterized cupin superfamily protein